MAKDQTAPWVVKKADQLVIVFLDQNMKVQNVPLFRTTLAKALDEAYERGLEEGMLLGKT